MQRKEVYMQERIKPRKVNTECDAYYGIVDEIKVLYKGNISEQEAHEAARNLINFVEILLELSRKMP